MAWMIIRTVLRTTWRSKKATILCAATLIISLITATLHLRLMSGSNPWSDSFLALQLLMFAGFAVTVSLPNHSQAGFLWNQRRIGPIQWTSERLILTQLAGEVLGATLVWAIVVLVQSCSLAILLETGFHSDFLLGSMTMLIAGITLLAWAQPIASLLPAPVAMLIVACILVLSHFLLGLQAQGDAGYMTGFSLGIEFITNNKGPLSGWSHFGLLLLLMTSSIGIANLLSTWILEGYQGSLCLLDRGKRRS